MVRFAIIAIICLFVAFELTQLNVLHVRLTHDIFGIVHSAEHKGGDNYMQRNATKYNKIATFNKHHHDTCKEQKKVDEDIVKWTNMWKVLYTFPMVLVDLLFVYVEKYLHWHTGWFWSNHAMLAMWAHDTHHITQMLQAAIIGHSATVVRWTMIIYTVGNSLFCTFLFLQILRFIKSTM